MRTWFGPSKSKLRSCPSDTAETQQEQASAGDLPQPCHARRLRNVFQETREFAQLLNVGDFLLLSRELLGTSRVYSEHPFPFGLVAEYVCSLKWRVGALAWLLEAGGGWQLEMEHVAGPCDVLHQQHQHSYDFSLLSFP